MMEFTKKTNSLRYHLEQTTDDEIIRLIAALSARIYRRCVDYSCERIELSVQTETTRPTLPLATINNY